ncbi:MAG: thymidylate kinase [Egibacteraceae bacterium]
MPIDPVQAVRCRRGLLVSVEGISGVGKTFLTNRLQTATTDDQQGADPRVVIIEAFSRRLRGSSPKVGHRILSALVTEAKGDRFLRAGYPRSETLLLLAVKMHDYESCLLPLQQGRLVLEGRSLHSVAVYQSLILHPEGPPQALAEAREILELAGQWRPLPDLTILLIDDVTAAIRRAEQRDNKRFTDEEWRMHHQAAALFEQLAAADPDRCRVIDRRHADTASVLNQITAWIDSLQEHLPCATLPWQIDSVDEFVSCHDHCRL